ncbi:MAG: hypothetical protein CV087_08770 [Candidatus Brocadia sp. WS118]|nr:MAG: hypothetical protein CV087_08770 [Candidatus Brocadia sp. WS118]
MAIAALPTEITATGFDQNSVFTLLQNILAVVNELQEDHATFKTVVTANKTAVNAIITAAATNIAAVAAVTPVSSSAPATLSNATALVLTKG